MEAVIIFFVLIGLVSALVAQTICRADQGLSTRLAEAECRRLKREIWFIELWQERRD